MKVPPRILLATPSVFNQYSGGGVLLTNLFWGWPSDRIAIVHRDSLPPDDRICQRFFRLSSEEMRRIWPIEELRNLFIRSRRKPHEEVQKQNGNLEGQLPSRTTPGAFNRLFQKVVRDGIPMRVKLSSELDEFIAALQPELIYTFLGDVPYMQLVNAIHERYPVPIVVHMMDDWPNVLYRRGLFGPFLRRQVEPLLRDLLNRASLRMGISESMCRAYEIRYKVPFESFHNIVDLKDWQEHRRTDYNAGSPFRLVYAGSIFPNAQLYSLVDVASAVAKLSASGVHIEMRIHSPFYTKPYWHLIENPPSVQFAPSPDDESITKLFKQADLLVLPVNFDEESVDYIRYSMPAKIPAYLASGTPILVYGPPGVAQVDYAQAGKWGYVVSKKGVEYVETAIRRLMEDKKLRARIGAKAVKHAEEHHDASKLRPVFQQGLIRAASH